MSDEKKTPQPGEWWVSNEDVQIAYICGFDFNGNPVYQTREVHDFRNKSAFLEEWRHEPLCTGWDWTPPPTIDPGEGWELLPVGTVREREDEFTSDAGKTWKGTKCYGERIPSDSLLTFRRRKPTAEQWPKYVVCDTWLLDAYIRRDSETVASGVKSDGKPFRNPYDWSEFEDGLILQGKWRYVTKAEALARVKPAELCASCGKPAIPGTAGCKDCTEYAIESVTLNTVPGKQVATAEVKITPVERTATPLVNAAVVESPDDWVEITDTHLGHIRRECDEVCNTECEPVWIPVRSSVGMPQSDFSFTRIRCRRRDLPALTPFPDQFAAVTTAIRSKKEAPRPALIPGVATDRMVDLFLSWRLPSDFQPDGGISFTSRPIHESWPTGTNLFTASQARKMIEHLLSVPEEAPPPAAPQPKRTPVDLIATRDNRVIWRPHGQTLMNDEQFIQHDAGGFYVEGE